MEKNIKDYLLELADELYESSKETIGEILEMDISEIDAGTLQYETDLIMHLNNMVSLLSEAERNHGLESVDEKLDLGFIRDMFDNRDELKEFLLGVLYEPYTDLDEFEDIIDNIVKLIFK